MENCGKMDVVVVVRGCGGVVVWWCFCVGVVGVVVFLWRCGVWWCFCGGVLVEVW